MAPIKLSIVMIGAAAVAAPLVVGIALYRLSRPHYLSCRWPAADTSNWVRYYSRTNHIEFLHPPGYEVVEQDNVITATDRNARYDSQTPEWIRLTKSRSSLVDAIRATGLDDEMMVTWRPPIRTADPKGVAYGNVLIADLSGRLQTQSPGLILHAKMDTSQPDSWEPAYEKWLATERAGGPVRDIIRTDFVGNLPEECERRDPESERPATTPEVIDQSIRFTD